ncbi:MAG: hypothetical protein KDA48_05515 [Amphiplicatus sp.]|nr:hypothetical protein [Amphiplicatus sp.]MCB9956082.1 hypothetical protein [Caulobacterales bacterium]HRX38977.1 hypothetical protein [Parvularculaceae bacterium]
MCFIRKQLVIGLGAMSAAALLCGAALAGDATAGGVAAGESQGGVTDRAFISAPPNWSYVVEREPGSFLDCGEGMDARMTDEDGRDLAALRCGVTLTETIAIPAAAQSARIIIHY